MSFAGTLFKTGGSPRLIKDTVFTTIPTKPTARVATTVALPGNTLANNQLTANANGAFPAIDTIGIIINEGLLVKDEVDKSKNGLYGIIDLGSAGSKWKLQRSESANTTLKMLVNSSVWISEGAVNADTMFTLTTDAPIILNTTDLTFEDKTTTNPPGGVDTQVQFNDGGIFGGSANYTFNKTTNVLTVNVVATDTVNEKSPTAGVNVDGVLLKDGGAAFISTVTIAEDIPIQNVQANVKIVFTDKFGSKIIRIGNGVDDGFFYNETANVSGLQSGGNDLLTVGVSGLLLGTTVTQKVGFYAKTPIVQQLQTVDLKDLFVNYGLISTTVGATPLNLDNGILTAGGFVADSSFNSKFIDDSNSTATLLIGSFVASDITLSPDDGNFASGSGGELYLAKGSGGEASLYFNGNARVLATNLSTQMRFGTTAEIDISSTKVEIIANSAGTGEIELGTLNDLTFSTDATTDIGSVDAGVTYKRPRNVYINTLVEAPKLEGGKASGGNLTLSSTSNATKGKIIFGISTYNEVNHRLGIGTLTPGEALSVFGDDVSSSRLRVYRFGNTTSGPEISFFHARGTKTVPTAILSGDEIGRIRSRSFDGTAEGSQTEISFHATQNWSVGSHGADMRFATTDNGSTSRTDRMRIDPNGNVGIGTTTTALEKLEVRGSVIAKDGFATKLFKVSTSVFETAVRVTEYISPNQHGGLYGTVFRKYFAIPDILSAGLTVNIALGLTPNDVLEIGGYVVENTSGDKILIGSGSGNTASNIGMHVQVVGSNLELDANDSLDWNSGECWIDYTK